MLALVDVTSKFRVTMDTNNEPAMFVYTGPYPVLNFYQCREGLYYFDTPDPNLFNHSVNAYSFLTTVQEIWIFFIELKLKELMLP